MPKHFNTDESRAALAGAVRLVETESAVELVVTVRARARSYRAIDLAVGIAAALATLAVLLFAPPPFALIAFLVEPVVVGVVAAAIAAHVPALHRALSREATRREAVAAQARSLFVEKGVHSTSARTGLLVHAALEERAVALVPDVGVEDALGAEALAALTRRVEERFAADPSPESLAEALREIAPPLAEALPIGDDDVNELPDGACAS